MGVGAGPPEVSARSQGPAQRVADTARPAHRPPLPRVRGGPVPARAPSQAPHLKGGSPALSVQTSGACGAHGPHTGLGGRLSPGRGVSQFIPVPSTSASGPPSPNSRPSEGHTGSPGCREHRASAALVAGVPVPAESPVALSGRQEVLGQAAGQGLGLSPARAAPRPARLPAAPVVCGAASGPPKDVPGALVPLTTCPVLP